MWQKFVVLLAGVLLLMTGVEIFLRRKARPGFVADAAHQRFRLAFAALLSFFLYLLLHEGGQALAAIAFGMSDVGHTDLFGEHGFPSPAFAAGTWIEEWQIAVLSAAGLVTPTAAGYVLAWFWLTSWGRTLRARCPTADAIWSFLICTVLFAHFGLLLSVAGLSRDSDYSAFVRFGPFLPWAVKLLVVLIALVNAAVLSPVVRHLSDIMRGGLAAETVPTDLGPAT